MNRAEFCRTIRHSRRVFYLTQGFPAAVCRTSGLLTTMDSHLFLQRRRDGVLSVH
jgi:hypothetical protein